MSTKPVACFIANVFFVSIFLICSIAFFWNFILLIHSVKKLDTPFIVFCLGTLLMAITDYCFIIPETFKYLFSPKDSPIVFNRKTKKVYINESEYFSFKPRIHPKYLLQPRKKNVKEYDWDDLHCVMIHNYSRNALVTTILMVCKPGTHQTISHIMLDPARAGIGSFAVWQWINNFMYHDRLARLNDGHYLSSQEAEFNRAHINRQGWPKLMLAAFNTESLEHLAQIKQQYYVK